MVSGVLELLRLFVKAGIERGREMPHPVVACGSVVDLQPEDHVLDVNVKNETHRGARLLPYLLRPGVREAMERYPVADGVSCSESNRMGDTFGGRYHALTEAAGSFERKVLIFFRNPIVGSAGGRAVSPARLRALLEAAQQISNVARWWEKFGQSRTNLW